MTSEGNLMKQSPDEYSFPRMERRRKKRGFHCGEIEFRLSSPNFHIRLLLQEPLRTGRWGDNGPFLPLMRHAKDPSQRPAQRGQLKVQRSWKVSGVLGVSGTLISLLPSNRGESISAFLDGSLLNGSHANTR